MYSTCVSQLGRKTFGARLKSAVLATAALGILGGSALAADLPSRKGPPLAPVYVPPAFTWTGFYVGLNAGYGWANNNRNNNGGFPFVGAVPFGGAVVPFASSGSSNNGGFIGGVQAGYNYQFGIGSGFVVGAETDIDWANINRNRNNGVVFGSFTLPQFPGTVFTPSNIATSNHNNNNQYIGTVRLRAGYAFDRILVYATGGLAYGGVNNNNKQRRLGSSRDHRTLGHHPHHWNTNQSNGRAGVDGHRHGRHQPQLEHQDWLDSRRRRRICLHPELDRQRRISL